MTPKTSSRIINMRQHLDSEARWYYKKKLKARDKRDVLGYVSTGFERCMTHFCGGQCGRLLGVDI